MEKTEIINAFNELEIKCNNCGQMIVSTGINGDNMLLVHNIDPNFVEAKCRKATGAIKSQFADYANGKNSFDTFYSFLVSLTKRPQL